MELHPGRDRDDVQGAFLRHFGEAGVSNRDKTVQFAPFLPKSADFLVKTAQYDL
jgi:hypothetical protein